MAIDGAAGKVHRARSLDGLERCRGAQVYDLRAPFRSDAVRRIWLQMHHENSIQIMAEQRQKRGVIRVSRGIGADIDLYID